VNADIHNVEERLEAVRSKLSQLPYSEILMFFIDHLESLGLSRARILKYATVYTPYLTMLHLEMLLSVKEIR